MNETAHPALLPTGMHDLLPPEAEIEAVVVAQLMAWVATINSRPAVARALAAVDEVRAKTTQFDKAGEGAKDRLFGRGRYAA